MRRAVAIAVALPALVACLLALPASAVVDDLDLVSRATGGVAADGASGEPAISADGRLVAFSSFAANLSDDDEDPGVDVFVRDLDTGVTTLVSRPDDPAAPAFSGSGNPSISADGGVVAFETAAPLAPGDSNVAIDVVARDTAAGATVLVSRADGAAGAVGDGSSFSAAVSADGRHVAFASQAENLSGDDAPGVQDVYVRDLVAGTTELVSRATGAAGAGGDADSSLPAISADGRFVAFESDATNLSTEDVDGARDVFVRDLAAGTTTLVSRADGPSGAPGDGRSEMASISGDGRVVAFTSAAANLSTDDGPEPDVFARDLAAGTTVLVSRASGPAGEPGDDDSWEPAVSADGRRIAFVSSASGLSTDDGGAEDVYVRDLARATTTLVSRAAGPSGATGPGGSRSPAITPDGRYVAFDSVSDALSAADVDGQIDVFRRDVLGPPPPPSGEPGDGGTGPGPDPGSGGPGGPVALVVRCAGVRATIVGTPRGEVIRGTRRRDVIAALGGADRVLGGAGNDLICLGNGNDRGIGGRGADRIVGGAGRDVLVGGAGADRLIGSAGRDRAIGGGGRDVCRAERKTGC
ncbi:MAG: calcium-binding protein [Thermoleophilia bacterium]